MDICHGSCCVDLFSKDCISLLRRDYNRRSTKLLPKWFSSYWKHSHDPWKPPFTSEYRSRPTKRSYTNGNFRSSTSNQSGGSSNDRKLQHDIFYEDLRKRYRHGSCSGFAPKPDRNIIAINVSSMGGKTKSTLIKRLGR